LKKEKLNQKKPALAGKPLFWGGRLKSEGSNRKIPSASLGGGTPHSLFKEPPSRRKGLNCLSELFFYG